MTIDKLNPKLLKTTGASDGDALVYVSANSQIEFGSVAVDTSSLSTSINTVQDNVATNATSITNNKTISDTFGTYANTTFATDTNLNVVQDNVATNASSITAINTNINTVQDNVATNATTITANKSILDTFGTYANTTFATDTNLNVVQDNVATNATTITANKSILDTFGTYANTTFGGGGGAVKVENAAGVIDGAIANIVFGTGLAATPTGSANTVTVSVTSPQFAYSYSSQVMVASGSANTFTMSRTVSNATNMFVAIDGLLQTPEDDYFVSGSTLTIANVVPIVANTEVEARYILTETSTSNLINDVYTASGSANTFTLTQTPVSSSSIMVVVGGILQSPGAPSNNYSVASTTLTLNNTAPIANNTVVSVRHLPAVG